MPLPLEFVVASPLSQLRLSLRHSLASTFVVAFSRRRASGLEGVGDIYSQFRE